MSFFVNHFFIYFNFILIFFFICQLVRLFFCKYLKLKKKSLVPVISAKIPGPGKNNGSGNSKNGGFPVIPGPVFFKIPGSNFNCPFPSHRHRVQHRLQSQLALPTADQLRHIAGIAGLNDRNAYALRLEQPSALGQVQRRVVGHNVPIEHQSDVIQRRGRKCRGGRTAVRRRGMEIWRLGGSSKCIVPEVLIRAWKGLICFLYDTRSLCYSTSSINTPSLINECLRAWKALYEKKKFKAQIKCFILWIILDIVYFKNFILQFSQIKIHIHF